MALTYPVKIEFKNYPSGSWEDWSQYLVEPPTTIQRVESDNDGEAGVIVFDSASVTFRYESGNPVYAAFSTDLTSVKRYLFRIHFPKTDKTPEQRMEGMADFSTISWNEHETEISFEIIDKLSALGILSSATIRDWHTFQARAQALNPDTAALHFDAASIGGGNYPDATIIRITQYDDEGEIIPEFTAPIIHPGEILEIDINDHLQRALVLTSVVVNDIGTWWNEITLLTPIHFYAGFYPVSIDAEHVKYGDKEIYGVDIINYNSGVPESIDGIKLIELLIKSVWTDAVVIKKPGSLSQPIPLEYSYGLIHDRPLDNNPLDALISLTNSIKPSSEALSGCYVYVNNAGEFVIHSRNSISSGGTARTLGTTKIISKERRFFWNKIVDGVTFTVKSYLRESISGEYLTGVGAVTLNANGAQGTIKPKNEIRKEIIVPVQSPPIVTQEDLDDYASQEAQNLLNFYSKRRSVLDLVLDLDDNTILWEIMDTLTINSIQYFFTSIEVDPVLRTIAIQAVETSGNDYDLTQIIVPLSESNYLGAGTGGGTTIISQGGTGSSYVFNFPLSVAGSTVSLLKTGNFKITDNQLDTIQGIKATDTPTFNQLLLSTQATLTTEAVRADRAVNTAFPLIGGGDLTGNRTLGLDFNTTNLKLTSNKLNTIQDIAVTSTPTFNQVTLSSAGGVNQAVRTDRTITGSAPITGGGDLTANRTLGLDYNTTNLKLTSDKLNTIQDIHIAATPQFAGLFLTGNITFQSQSSYTISTNTGNLILSPANGHLKLQATGTDPNILIGDSWLKREGFVSQLTGWGISAIGEADFRYLYVDELHAKAFIADLEQALAGAQIICKSVALVGADFNLPSAGNAAQLVVMSFAGFETAAVFQDGDLVRLRQWERVSGGLTIADAWGTVVLDTTYGSGGFNTADKTQGYIFTRHSTVPGSASGIIKEGTIALDYGVSGDGFIESNAIDGMWGQNSPYHQVVTWHTTPGNYTIHSRTGNLRGITGITGEYGMILGSGVTLTDKYIRASNQAFQIHNIPFDIYNNSNTVAQIDVDGNMKLGTNVSLAASTSFHFASSNGSLRVGFLAASKANLYFDGTSLKLRINTSDRIVLDPSTDTITIGNTSSYHTLLDSSSLKIKSSSTVLADFGASVLIGQTGVSQSNIFITSGAVKLRNNTTDYISLDTSGNVLIGRTGSSQSNVYISSGAIYLRNNTTPVITLQSDGSGLFEGNITSNAIITGGVIRTAATGQRIVLNESASNSIKFYTPTNKVLTLIPADQGSLAYLDIGNGGIYSNNSGTSQQAFFDYSIVSLYEAVNTQTLIRAGQLNIQDLSNTTSVDLFADGTISSLGDLKLNPAGNNIYPVNNYDINLGKVDKKYLTLHAAELLVETLVSQNTVATIGGRIIVAKSNILIADLTAGGIQIFVKYNNLSSGDIIYLEANGNVEFMAITSGATSVFGGYRYNVTRNLDGTGANQWYAGDAIVNTGQTGNGFIDIYSIQSVGGASEQGPTIVGNIRNSSTYNDWSEAWAIGNLSGLYGQSSGVFGVGLGKYVDNSPFVLVTASGGIQIKRKAVGEGTDNILAQWDLSGNITIGNTGGSHTYISSSGLQLKSGSNVRINLNNDGSGSLANGNISWDTSGALTAGGWTINSASIKTGSGASNIGLFTFKSGSGYFQLGDALVADGEATGSGAFIGYDGPAGEGAFFVGDPTSWHLKYSATTGLVVKGVITATAGQFLGPISVGTATNKIHISATGVDTTTAIYSKQSAFGSPVNGFWLDASGRFGLGNKLLWDGTTLTVAGGIFSGSITSTATITGGTIQTAASAERIAIGTVNSLPTISFYSNSGNQAFLRTYDDGGANKGLWLGSNITELTNRSLITIFQDQIVLTKSYSIGAGQFYNFQFGLATYNDNSNPLLAVLKRDGMTITFPFMVYQNGNVEVETALKISGGTLNLGSDVSLFRDAANVLKTSDKLIIAQPSSAGGGIELIQASTSQWIDGFLFGVGNNKWSIIKGGSHQVLFGYTSNGSSFTSRFEIDISGSIRAYGGYRSADNSAGITKTIQVVAVDGTHTFTFKNGILTAHSFNGGSES